MCWWRDARRCSGCCVLGGSKADGGGGYYECGGLKHRPPPQAPSCPARWSSDGGTHPCRRFGAQREVEQNTSAHEDRQPKCEAASLGDLPGIQPEDELLPHA